MHIPTHNSAQASAGHDVYESNVLAALKLALDQLDRISIDQDDNSTSSPAQAGRPAVPPTWRKIKRSARRLNIHVSAAEALVARQLMQPGIQKLAPQRVILDMDQLCSDMVHYDKALRTFALSLDATAQHSNKWVHDLAIMLVRVDYHRILSQLDTLLETVRAAAQQKAHHAQELAQTNELTFKASDGLLATAATLSAGFLGTVAVGAVAAALTPAAPLGLVATVMSSFGFVPAATAAAATTTAAQALAAGAAVASTVTAGVGAAHVGVEQEGRLRGMLKDLDRLHAIAKGIVEC